MQDNAKHEMVPCCIPHPPHKQQIMEGGALSVQTGDKHKSWRRRQIRVIWTGDDGDWIGDWKPKGSQRGGCLAP